MTQNEAAQAGVENRHFYMRIGDVESNLAPPSADINQWFEKKSVPIENGEYVGALAAWRWPDAFKGVTPESAAEVRRRVMNATSPIDADIRGNNWIGKIIAEVLDLDLGEAAGKARAKSIATAWITSDVLRVEEVPNKSAGKDRTKKLIVAGENNPLGGDV